MKLQALTPELLQHAMVIYQDLAYGGSNRAQRRVELPRSGEGELLLKVFTREQVEPIPGHCCVRYSLRLGNRNYPFMKLLLQEHLVAGEFFFAVDTHDQMDIKPDFPDYDAWMAVRRFNRDLKQRIESQFDAEGIDTAASLCRVLGARRGGDCDNGTGRGLVLIVDDEEDLADAVEMVLRQHGYRTTKVHDGIAALEAAADCVPDLVLLDYELPEMDGLEVIAHLRRNAVTQSLPVILTSGGKVSMADIRKADGFLAKPFQESLLLELVQRVLRAPRESRR